MTHISIEILTLTLYQLFSVSSFLFLPAVLRPAPDFSRSISSLNTTATSTSGIQL